MSAWLEGENQRRRCHVKFCAITGRDYRYELNRYDWELWSCHFTEADLELVLRWITAENRKRDPQYRIRITLQRIIGDLQMFDSYRAEAECWHKAQEARKRRWQPTERERTLAAWRHEDVQAQAPDTPAKRVDMSLVIDALKNETRQNQQ